MQESSNTPPGTTPSSGSQQSSNTRPGTTPSSGSQQSSNTRPGTTPSTGSQQSSNTRPGTTPSSGSQQSSLGPVLSHDTFLAAPQQLNTRSPAAHTHVVTSVPLEGSGPYSSTTCSPCRPAAGLTPGTTEKGSEPLEGCAATIANVGSTRSPPGAPAGAACGAGETGHFRFESAAKTCF
eukprot:365866-Chlamydomonas_euryale.AAC.11